MLIALTGLLAGSLHVVTGPDHLAALAPLAVEDRRTSLPTGPALLYLAAYLASAIASMGAFGGLLGRVLQRFGTLGLRRVMATSGAAAVAVGITWTTLALAA